SPQCRGVSHPTAAAGTRSPAPPSATEAAPPFFEPSVSERPQTLLGSHPDGLLPSNLESPSAQSRQYCFLAATRCVHPLERKLGSHFSSASKKRQRDSSFRWNDVEERLPPRVRLQPFQDIIRRA